MLIAHIRNLVVEDMRRDLNLPISCKNHRADCDSSGDIEETEEHEEDCPYCTVRCIVLREVAPENEPNQPLMLRWG